MAEADLFDKKIMGNASSEQWTLTYNQIKEKHDEAFVTIEQAISLEEQEKPHEAIEKYKDGIRLIDEALNIQVQCPETPDLTWEKACVMIQKIKKTRAEVLTRINSIKQSNIFINTEQPPPSYEEAMSSSEAGTPVTYRDLATALNGISVDTNQQMDEDVIYTHEAVRLYFISPNGDVSSTNIPQTLKISLVEGSEPNAPRAILQVGDWVYPLVPSVSPCYRTNYGAFVLPDVYSDVQGSAIGLILPSDAEEDVFDLLENILNGIITQETTQAILQEKLARRLVDRSEDISEKISHKIVDGAMFLSNGLIKGAEKASEFLNNSTPKVINNMSSAERPTQINPKVSKSIKVAESATSKAVKVSGFVAEKVGVATMRLGKFLAPHIQKQGTKLLTKTCNLSEEEASNKVKSVLTVAAGAVEGFSTVYRGLETSASILGNNLRENTVKIIEHKYGVPAAEVTGDSFNAMGNVYCTYRNTKVIAPKHLVRTTAAMVTTQAMTSTNVNNYNGTLTNDRSINEVATKASCSSKNEKMSDGSDKEHQ